MTGSGQGIALLANRYRTDCSRAFNACFHSEAMALNLQLTFSTWATVGPSKLRSMVSLEVLQRLAEVRCVAKA